MDNIQNDGREESREKNNKSDSVIHRYIIEEKGKKDSKNGLTSPPSLVTDNHRQKEDFFDEKDMFNPERKEDIQKRKKKKEVFRFPLIQGSGIQTVREVEEVKKRKRHSNIKEISPHSWR